MPPLKFLFFFEHKSFSMDTETEWGARMWGKKDNMPPAPPEKPSGPPVSSVQEAKAVSSIPMVKPSEAERERSGGGHALIGKSVQVKGEISGSEDLYVDGEVRGAIELREHSLTVGPHGKVEANVNAREIIVNGALNGNVHASEKIEIRKTGSLMGDLTTARIIIEDGAYFKGSIDILKSGQKTEAPPKVLPSVSVPAKPSVQPPLQMVAVETRNL